MGDYADRDDIDAMAAKLFRRDHPERLWSSLGIADRLGAAPPHVKAMYRGFARAQMSQETGPVAAAALAAGRGGAPRVALQRYSRKA